MPASLETMKRYFSPIFLVLLLVGCASSNTTPNPLSVKTNTPIKAPPTTKTPIALETPIEAHCLVNPLQVDFFTGENRLQTVEPSGQSGLCRFTQHSWPLVSFSLLFPSRWEVSLMGSGEGLPPGYVHILGFRPETSAEPEIFVLGQLADLPLKNADAGIDSGDTLKEKSTLTIGDKQVLVTISINGDQTIKRYFIHYDSNDKEPRARLFAFEAAIPTAQFDQPEFQERLKAVEAMIVSFQYLLP